MSVVSHQTIKLSRGKHSSPADGACVMELASMLTGESFSDRPASVCPVIGSLLRSYNDYADDARRQDLIRYAARVVGTRASVAVERRRAQRVYAWTLERLLPGPAARFLARMWRPPIEDLGAVALNVLPEHRGATHRAVLGLVDELVEMGNRGPAESQNEVTSLRAAAPTRS
jgi:hypothetical protein